MRDQTKVDVATVIRLLRCGKTPKEVASTMQTSWERIRQIIYRHQTVRVEYIKTYPLRYPHLDRAPEKIVRPLKQANEL